MTALAAPSAALTPGRYTTAMLRPYRLRPASDGDLRVYVANGRNTVARIRNGAVAWASHQRIRDDLTEILADPHAAASRYTVRTGRCARCTREITGPGPYGPECVGKEPRP